jgi:hypothetical protein
VDKKKGDKPEAHELDPEFQDQLHEKTKKIIKDSNPGLHSVMEKYKNFHADNQEPTKKD